MLLIIGGAARTGKGILARRLLLETHQPYLSLDVLKMGLANGLPLFGLDPDAHPRQTAEQLWPIVYAMAVNMIETGVHYTIEGEMLPVQADELARRFPGEVRACFLGYTQVAPRKKLAEIRQFGGFPNDWIADYSDEEVLSMLEQFVAFSRYLQEEARLLHIPYFDTSENFEEAHHRAFAYLMHGHLQQN